MKWDTADTAELIRLSQQGDERARSKLVCDNEPLVRSVIKRFLGRGTEYEDLLQVGNIGLLKAVAGFDTSFNVRFSTYAVPMISGEVKRFVRDNSPVKMPRSLKDMQQKLRYARRTLAVEKGREATVEEIAERMGCDEETVLYVLESMSTTVSLDEPLSEDGDTAVLDMLEDRNKGASIENKLALRQCLDQLEEKEKKVILLRYFKNYTQSRTADILGISQVQISRIESRTIEKLRRKMR